MYIISIEQTKQHLFNYGINRVLVYINSHVILKKHYQIFP